jgi:zinc protease
LYHAAAALASGHVLALVEAATQLLISLGMNRKEAARALLPLTRQVLANFERVGPPAAWTGPLARGDYRIIEAHVRALRGSEQETAQTYEALNRLAVRVLAGGSCGRYRGVGKSFCRTETEGQSSRGMRVKQLHIAIEHKKLANGLRVVVAPDSTAPVVTVGVYYKIGFRLEPRGRSGFAHLFEHMMFQGSANAPKMQHIKLINSSGGVLNGSTSYDVTNYYQAVPSNALERVLWLEADRMRALKVDDENLKNQRDVVKEEVRVNVMNEPYGGFPWLDMPPVAFRNWANAHNFYGDFADLDAAHLGDVQAFFKTYYLPNNAVLLVLGDVKAGEGMALAEKHFGSVPAGAPPVFADPSEPEQTEERRGYVEEKFGTLPAMAIGYLMPKRRTADWCAMALLDQALHGGRAGRLYRDLVLERQIAVEADGGIDDLFGYNGPTQMTSRIMHKPEYSSDAALAAFDTVILQAQEKGISADELEQLKVKWRSDYYATLESGRGGYMPKYGLMHLLACFTLFDDEPQLVNTILEGFLAVTPEHVNSVAQKYLRNEKRAIVFRTPAKTMVKEAA